MRTWFLPSTSFQSNGCFFQGQFRTTVQGIIFFCLWVSEAIWELQFGISLPFPCCVGGMFEVRTTLVQAGSMGRPGRKGQGEAAGEPQPWQPSLLSRTMSPARKTAPESFLFIIPAARWAKECTKGILFLQRNDSLQDPEQRKTFAVQGLYLFGIKSTTRSYLVPLHCSEETNTALLHKLPIWG